MSLIQASVKLARAVAHLLRGWWTIIVRFPHLDAAQRADQVQCWARDLLRALDVRLTVEGDPLTPGPVLRVCNHISWLDIMVILAAGHCRFVSKAQVRGWPVIGVLATGAGTLFIERESRKDAMRVVHHMADRLRAGDVLMVFPEGTTSDGADILPFHANLLQAAISANCAVQSVGLRYKDCSTGGASTAAAYIGDDSLVGSLWRTVSAPPFEAVLRFGPTAPCAGLTRRQWATELQETVKGLRAE